MAEVLVVDDDRDVRRLVARLLRAAGHDAAAAAGGTEALQYLDGHKPQLVILDVMMPGMDGLEVLRTMRSDARFRDIPVLMYSALTDSATRDAANRLGAQGYLLKGTDWSVVYPQIQQHIG